MQIHLSPRHLPLTASIHAHVASKVEHLESITDTIVAAHVVLLYDEAKSKPFIVKIHLAVPGPDLHAQDAQTDLYIAIDKTVDKLARQLRKRKTRLKLTKKHKDQLAREGDKRGYTRR